MPTSERACFTLLEPGPDHRDTTPSPGPFRCPGSRGAAVFSGRGPERQHGPSRTPMCAPSCSSLAENVRDAHVTPMTVEPAATLPDADGIVNVDVAVVGSGNWWPRSRRRGGRATVCAARRAHRRRALGDHVRARRLHAEQAAHRGRRRGPCRPCSMAGPFGIACSVRRRLRDVRDGRRARAPRADRLQ